MPNNLRRTRVRMPRKDTAARSKPTPAMTPKRASTSLPGGTGDFVELLTVPELQWPVARDPVEPQEHRRRRGLIAKLAKRCFDGGTPS